MSEADMVEHVQRAVNELGDDDTILAVGQFEPRGHVGAGFAGGLLGSSIGDELGGVVGAVGTVGGYVAGGAANDRASGLPAEMLIGVSATTVYGFAARSRSAPPTQLVFSVARARLEVKVHQRVNVRVVELIDAASGSRIELEGNRIPVTHSKDVIDELIKD